MWNTSVPLLLSLLACLGFGLPARAATLYVDPGHPQATDAMSCAPANPCLTITAAAGLAQAGDTVLIAPGVYREALDLPRDGLPPDQPITFAAREAGTVHIRGSDVVDGWRRHSDAVWRKDAWPVNSQQVFVDGRPLRQTGRTCPFHDVENMGKPFLSHTGKGVDDLAPGSFFYDEAGQTLFIRLADDSPPGGKLVEASVRPFAIVPRERESIHLSGLEFAHSNVSSLGIYASMANAWGRNWRIRDCSFRQADFSGLAVVGEGHLIDHCRFEDNGDVGLTILGTDEAHGWAPVPGRGPQNITVRDSSFTGNNTRGFDPAWQAGGIKASTSCTGLVLEGLRLENNNGPGLWLDVFCRDVLVERCLARNNTVGVVCEISDQAVIRNNMILDNDFGVLVAASSGVAVVNNTLHNNGYGVVLHGMPRQEHPELKHNRVFNNVFSQCADTDLVLLDNPSMNAVDNVSNHNVFLNPQGRLRHVVTGGESFRPVRWDLARIREESGQETKSKASSYIFARVSDVADLAPRPDGPLLDAGAPDAPVGDTDYFGNPRRVDATGQGTPLPDAGAVEFQITPGS